jgi:anti-anti-sigma factor
VVEIIGARGSAGQTSDELRIAWGGEPVRLTVVGEIDVSTHGQFRAALGELLGGLGDVQLDLTGVPFMDTRSVTLVVHTAQRLHEDGGRLVVHEPPPSLVRIFETLWGDDGASLYISGRRGEP